jgi:D-aspartate ligase
MPAYGHRGKRVSAHGRKAPLRHTPEMKLFADGRQGDRPFAIPCVVMGLEPVGLGVARALGRAGLDVVGVSTDEDPPAAHSRLFRFRRDPTGREPKAELAFYLQLGEELGGQAVIFPTGDVNLKFLSAHEDQLSPTYRFLIAPRDLLSKIISKREFPILARKLGLPLPTTVMPADENDLRALAPSLRYPVVIKPEFTYLWRTSAARDAGLRYKKLIAVEDETELFSVYRKLAETEPRMIVQEMIQGPDENHISYGALIDHQGRTRGEFASRKPRLAPAHFGLGACMESVRADDVIEQGRFVLSQLGYRGIASVQFKRDERDGRLYLMEINVRFPLWCGLAYACGLDYPFYYYLSCIGEDYEPASSYKVGKLWVNFADDWNSMKTTYSKDGTWSWPRWVASLARTRVWSLFAADDPVPSWVGFRRFVRRTLTSFGRTA